MEREDATHDTLAYIAARAGETIHAPVPLRHQSALKLCDITRSKSMCGGDLKTRGSPYLSPMGTGDRKVAEGSAES